MIENVEFNLRRHPLGVHFIRRCRQRQTLPTPPPPPLTQSNPPPFRNVNRKVFRMANTPPIKTSWKLNQKKYVFLFLLYFIAFFCSRYLSLSLSVSRSLIVLLLMLMLAVVLCCWYRWANAATHRMAMPIHPSRHFCWRCLPTLSLSLALRRSLPSSQGTHRIVAASVCWERIKIGKTKSVIE